MSRTSHQAPPATADIQGITRRGREGPDSSKGTERMHVGIVEYMQARFAKTERGAALVEYALLLALIAVVCIVALTTLGGQASSKFTDVGNSISAAGG